MVLIALALLIVGCIEMLKTLDLLKEIVFREWSSCSAAYLITLWSAKRRRRGIWDGDCHNHLTLK